MIKTKPVRCQQQFASRRSILYSSAYRDDDRSVVHYAGNPRAGESYQPTPLTFRTIPISCAFDALPDFVDLSSDIQAALVDRLKHRNTEHWASELFNGTTDCIQLPAITPRSNKPFTVDLSSPVLQSITGGNR